MMTNSIIASFMALGLWWAAGIPQSPQTSSQGRSCDGITAVRADTIIASTDPILRSLRPSSGAAPRYPTNMRDAGITGEVTASFVVDTLGTVPKGGAWIQHETRPSFGDAVCAYLASTRFAPLVVNGKPVSVRVENAPWTFDIKR